MPNASFYEAQRNSWKLFKQRFPDEPEADDVELNTHNAPAFAARPRGRCKDLAEWKAKVVALLGPYAFTPSESNDDA